MKFSIGDKILLKQTGEEGHVVAYINNKMVEVEINNTIFPVYVEDIDHPYLKWFTEKKKVKKMPSAPEQLPVEKEKLRKPRLARGIYLSFLPVFKPNEAEDIVDYLKVHLLNETPESIRFRYSMKPLAGTGFDHEGSLHAFGHVYLHNVPFEEMSDQPRFHWEIANEQNNDLAVAADVLKIRPRKLFDHIQDVLKNNEPSFSYLLLDDFKPKPTEAGTRERFIAPDPPPASHFSKLLTDFPRYEVDLHIEKLVSNIQGLSNGDMLQLQLDTLQKYLQLAIAGKQEKMVVIHGIGKGVLKEEVHKLLKQTPQVKRYKNQWEAQYGYGATIVEFRY